MEEYIKLLIYKDILRIKQDKLIERLTNGENVYDEVISITDEYQSILMKLLDNPLYKDDDELSIDEKIFKYECIIRCINDMLENNEIDEELSNIILIKYKDIYGYLVKKESRGLKRVLEKKQ